MNSYHRIIISLILLTASCTTENGKPDENIIDISETYNNRQKIPLSKIATKIEYIPLETDNSYLLSAIREPYKDIKFYDDLILITDLSGQLYMFNNSGKFLSRIGTVGRGPGEYANTDSFAVVHENSDSLIAVYSAAQNRTFIYNFGGEFIRDLDTDFYPRGLTSVADNLVFINPIGGRNLSNYYTMSIVSTIGTLKERLFHKKEEEIVEQKHRLALTGFFHSYKKEDTLSYWESNYDTIWRITDDLKTIPKFAIYIGDNKMPLKEQTEEGMFNFENVAKYNRIENVFEADRFVFLNTFFEGRYHTVYYDKLTQKGFSVEYKKPFGRGIQFSFYNDIDGGMPFWPMGKVTDSKMFMIIQSNEIKEYVNRIGEDHEGRDKKARNQMMKIVQGRKNTDNPVLMIVTLKKD